MKKLLATLLASTMALSAMGGLVACGGGRGDGDDGIQKVDLPSMVGVDTDDPVASMENEDLTQVPACELTVWAPGEAKNVYEPMVENIFKSTDYKNGKYANVTVKWVAIGEGDVATNMGAAPEDGADVFFFASDQYATLKNGNVLQPLAGDVGKYYSAAVQARDGEGAYAPVTDPTNISWAFPTAVNTFFMWYDSTFYEEEDLDSLDKLMEKAQAQNKNIMIALNTAWYSMTFFHGMGCTTDFIDGDYVTDIDTSDNGWLAAQAMYDYLNPDRNNGCIIDAPQDLNTDVPAGFNDSSVVAAFEGDWISNNMPAKAKATILPKFKDANGVEHRLKAFDGSKYCGVNAKRPNQAVSLALANFLTGEKAQRTRYEEAGSVPTNVKAAEYANSNDTNGQGVVKAALAQAEYSYMQNRQTNLWNVGNVFVTGIASGTTTTANLRDQLKQLADGLRG